MTVIEVRGFIKCEIVLLKWFIKKLLKKDSLSLFFRIQIFY